MQPIELLLLAVLAVATARLVAGARFAWLRYSLITGAGLSVMAAGWVLEGWRWQMIPAYAASFFLVPGLFKKSDTRLVWRLLAAVPLAALVGLAAVLAHLMPVVNLPAPAGPYGVGTFDFSIIDPDRVERFAPGRSRELYVEVWYPASSGSLEESPVRTLFHDLYRGDYNRTSFLFGYTARIDTHSHVDAPPASSGDGPFPVLLFNHALGFGFTSQNQLLMEHLASHGYVVFSIGHPYQTAKINLGNAGTVFRANRDPSDLDLPRPKIYNGIVGRTFDATNDMKKVSDLKALLYPLSRAYVALPERDRAAFLQQAISAPEFEPFGQLVTEELLLDFIDYEYIRDGSLVQYWVEDNQFILDSLANLPAPVAGFPKMLDLERLGVFGVSYGGAVAGEFCKIDRRCKAGINSDGTQLGRHWDTRLPVPFLMLYHDGHQGGNDYALVPPMAEYREYRIRGAAHTDFTDFAYLWPILKPIGFSGSIDGWRMMEILNQVHLDFFDQHLKGKASTGTPYGDVPEIEVRR